jgi:hypothetical protein
MAGYKLVLESVAAGTALTLLTGLYNSTPGHLLGAVWYGLPLAWVRYLVVGPQYNPWAVDFVGLVADICVWAVVAGIVILLATRARKKR